MGRSSGGASTISFGSNEVQRITIAATGGTFTLSDGAETTGPLAFDITALDLASALGAFASIINPANLSIIGGPGDATGSTPYFVEFINSLAQTDVPQLTLDGSNLIGDAGSGIATIVGGDVFGDSPSAFTVKWGVFYANVSANATLVAPGDFVNFNRGPVAQGDRFLHFPDERVYEVGAAGSTLVDLVYGPGTIIVADTGLT